MLCIVRSGIWPSRTLRPLGGEPRNYIRDFLLRHRFAGDVSAPVRRAEFRAAGDGNGAQALIADERKKSLICDVASFWSPVAAHAVAGSQ